METIGVRELRQHASRWLERVRRGESFTITDRGRPVALLSPARTSTWSRLVDAGEIDLATRTELTTAPLAVPPGSPSASDVLRAMREGERW